MNPWITYAVTLSALLITNATRAADGRAVVRAVRGTAEYSTSHDKWKPLKVGKVLGAAAVVRTGVNSGVNLFLGENGPTVSLFAETTLGLDKLNLDRTGVDVVIETFLDLRTGTIQGTVRGWASGSKYEVKTPLTRCEIRATEWTEYQISADGKHHVVKGSLIVFYFGGLSGVGYTVNAGQTLVPPADLTVPGAQPILRPTLPSEMLLPPEPIRNIDFLTPPFPEPIQFISPGSGRPVRNE